MKKLLVLCVLFAFMVSPFVLFAAGGQERAPAVDPYDEWMRNAQIGPYLPEVEDWDAIYEAAKKEGKVIIYASSSRIFDATQSFEEAYPGITVEAYNISTVEILEKIEREHQAGIRNADLILTGGIPPVAEDLLARQIINDYCPSILFDVIPEHFRTPYLTARLGATVMAYSDVVYSGEPIESIWELTLPEWKDKSIIRDPLRSSGSLEWVTTFVRYADEMEAEYERFFGRPIELTTENAGYEFIKRLLNNGLQLASGSRDALDAVSVDTIAQPPIGQITSSNYRDVMSGRYQFDILYDMKPKAGMAGSTGFSLVGFAPHPNAAKLLMLWILGGPPGTEGYAGFEPWFVTGNWPVRTDMGVPEPFLPLAEYNFWFQDQKLFDLMPDVMDFWLVHM